MGSEPAILKLPVRGHAISHRTEPVRGMPGIDPAKSKPTPERNERTMKGKISAFYGADVFSDEGGKVGRIPNKTSVLVTEPFGKPRHHTGEWCKVQSDSQTGWVHASQVEV